MNKKSSYSSSGVDIDLASRLLSETKQAICSTHTNQVVDSLGDFAALFSLGQVAPDYYLVSATDGVGTKLKVAFDAKEHRSVGIDLVAMNVNDILCHGARPLFFLDYLSLSHFEGLSFSDIIEGIVEGCRQSGCSLVGGETAQMPAFYPKGHYDLAGFSVGIVHKDKMIDGCRIQVDDVVLGVQSSGLHSNGYSLARNVCFDQMKLSLSSSVCGRSLQDWLLEPTLIYVQSVLAVLQAVDIHGLAHITGGGIVENLSRILPSHLKAVVDVSHYPVHDFFAFLQQEGQVDMEEMFRVFNMGVGFVCVCQNSDVSAVQELFSSFDLNSFPIGHIEKRSDSLNAVQLIHLSSYR